MSEEKAFLEDEDLRGFDGRFHFDDTSMTAFAAMGKDKDGWIEEDRGGQNINKGWKVRKDLRGFERGFHFNDSSVTAFAAMGKDKDGWTEEDRKGQITTEEVRRSKKDRRLEKDRR